MDFEIQDKILVKYRGNEEIVTVPDGVEAIADSAFYFCDFVKEIFLPDSVKFLGTMCFGECYKLKRIHMPAMLQGLGAAVFDSCFALEEVILPDTVQFIGERCFSKCGALKKVQLSRSMRAIPRASFMGCIQLQEVIVPESIVSVDGEAFMMCRNLEELVMPGVISDIRPGTFHGCNQLHRGYFPGMGVLGRSIDEQTIFAMMFLSCQSMYSDYQAQLFHMFMKDQARRVGERIVELKCHPAMKLFLEFDYLSEKELEFLVEKARGYNDIEMASMMLRCRKAAGAAADDDMWEL